MHRKIFGRATAANPRTAPAPVRLAAWCAAIMPGALLPARRRGTGREFCRQTLGIRGLLP